MMSQDSESPKRPRATTEYGVVEGLREHGIEQFRNVPFAAPPFGPLRYRPPAAPETWEGVRDASTAGVGVPQPGVGPEDLDTLYANPPVTGEDCLTLEVNTPDVSSTGLPVMVWIHGGGFMFGAGSTPAYRGWKFARDGVIYVSINYRLGVEGFLPMGEDTDNLGLRDQVFALEWVQRNIAAFGGDPANVTVFGQSAGAISVLALLAMPSARGLFVRAISESGTPFVAVSVDRELTWTRKMARRLGVPPTRDGFASVPIEKTVAETLPLAFTFVNPLRTGSEAFKISPYRPVYNTPSLPEPLLAAATTASGIPLLTGTTQNEATGFLKALGRLDGINPVLALVFRRLMHVNGKIRRAYRDGPRHITGGLRLVEAAWTDFGLRMPTIELAETRADPTYLYEFRWESTGFPKGLGSVHSLENPFVRDDFDSAREVGEPGRQLVTDDPPQDLATLMHETWIRFATTGDPGWPVYTSADRQSMVFDTASRVVSDAAGAERIAWQGRSDTAK